MKKVPVRFGDHRDHCLNCQHSLEYCEKVNKLCRYNEATYKNALLRGRANPIVHSDGIKDDALNDFNFWL